MGSNPINLTVRFFLELTALIAMGFWGWNQREGVLRFVLALGFRSSLLSSGAFSPCLMIPLDPVMHVFQRLEFFAWLWN